MYRPLAEGAGGPPRSRHQPGTAALNTFLPALTGGSTGIKVVGGLGFLALGAPAMMGVAYGAVARNEDRLAERPDEIVYVGMNKESAHEVKNLRSAVGESRVHFIGPGGKQDRVTVGGQEHDLSTESGRSSFARAIGLRGDRAKALEAVLADSGEMTKDEVARLSIVLRQAEKGERRIERLVLSGHSVGEGVWGDNNGDLKLSLLAKLSIVFPDSFSQIQDLLMAACNSGGHYSISRYREIFPNLKTVWAYDGSAPGAVSGAVPHILRWERGTRGERTDLSRKTAEHTRKGENVAVWTVSKGFDNGQPVEPIAEARARYAASHAVVPGFLSGASVVESPGYGPLSDHYDNIQKLLSRPDLGAEERKELEKERDQVVRLLYYQNIRSMFALTHGAELEQAYAEIGHTAVDFSKLSRADALKAIQKFDDRVASMSSVSSTVKHVSRLLHEGLVDLSPSLIPGAWIWI